MMRKYLPSEFYTIWTNYDLLCSDLQEKDVNTSFSAPIIRYPTIDIAKCNIRSLANVPKPFKYQILGCSDDPEFYKESHNMYQPAGKFYKIDPHGAEFGYMTQLGVVQVPDEPVHGYTWDGTGDGRWVLCAVHPPDQGRKEVERSQRKGVTQHHVSVPLYSHHAPPLLVDYCLLLSISCMYDLSIDTLLPQPCFTMD